MKKISWHELTELRKKGLGYRKLAKILNVSQQTITNWLAQGRIGKNHSYKKYERNDEYSYFSFFIPNKIKEKIKQKAKKENKFMYEVMNDILNNYFKNGVDDEKIKRRND